MKEKEIVEIIEDRFKKIDTLAHIILNDFDEEAIHDLRVEVKKLRAFLRLLDIKKDLLKFSWYYAMLLRHQASLIFL